jgi:hypothetical protein
MPDRDRQRLGSLGGLTAAANAYARNEQLARMAHVRENSPASDSYWARELGFANPDQPTPEQQKEINTARKLYFAQLRQSSVAGIKRAKATRLRDRAAAIEAEVEAGEGGGL